MECISTFWQPIDKLKEKAIQKWNILQNTAYIQGGGGALTWNGGMGMCGPQGPPFHASPAIHKIPSWGLNADNKTLIWKMKVKFCIQNQQFSENMPHFHSNLSAHKPPSSEIRAAHTYQKKLSAPQAYI